MKFSRSQSPKKTVSRLPAAGAGPDLFDALDSFLTGLILDRAPVDARTGLGDWLGAIEGKPAKPRARKRKPALASA